jgi:predicted amidohydrolase YtcJ
VACEVGAVLAIAEPFLTLAYGKFGELMAAELRRVNAAGVTTIADLGWNPEQAPLFAAAREHEEFTARLRLYEMSRPGGSGSVPVVNGDDVVRQVGIKTWADGSPWVGNIATSFAYLTNETTEQMGLKPGHHGQANFTQDQLAQIARPYAAEGWQLACHAHGDLAIDSVLNAWEAIIGEGGLTDHRFRLEHVGAMTAAQFERAAALGVTASVFVDHLYYWGDVLVDGLFGEPGTRWADAQAAIAAGVRVTFHNDGTVTPLEPFRNMSVAMTRLSSSGRTLDGAEGVGLDAALRAHTIDAAWQVLSEDHIGSIEVGKYADLIIIDQDPHAVSAQQVADIQVLATYMAGTLVFERTFTSCSGRPQEHRR